MTFAINVDGMNNPGADTLALVDNIALALNFEYQVRPTEQGWIEVRVNPAAALRDKLDFIRIADDDGTLRVFHLTHNEVLRGSASFTGSLAGLVPTVVREMCDSIF